MAGEHFATGRHSSNGDEGTVDDVDGRHHQQPSSGRWGLLAELTSQVRWLLAERAPWIIVLPIIGVVAALFDLTLMVCLVQALLHLAHSSSHGTLPGLSREVSTGTLLIVAAVAGLGSVVLRSAESLLVGRLSARAATHSRQQVIDAQLRADWWTVSRQRAGFVQQLVGINTQYASTAPGMLATAVSSIINLAMYGAFVVVSSPLVALLFTTLGAAASGGFFALRTRMKRFAKVSKASSVEVQLLATSLHGLSRELRVFGVTEGARRELKDTNDEARAPLARLRTMQRLLPVLFQQVVLLLVILVVAVAWSAGVDAARFGAAAILAVRSLSYLQNLNTAVQQYVEARPFLEELQTTVRRTQAAEVRRGDIELGRVNELALEGVCFEYERGRQILHDVSFDLHSGERLGIVGPSGGGKTTLVSLVAGLIRPSSGHVLVNGLPLEDYTARSWSDQIALVGQEPLLLRGTIASNIAFFRDVSDAQIRDAARRAAILDTIDALPAGLDTEVGDGLGDLSGGQRQRIALARALLTKPSVLLLDEPTSALDSENADRIRETVEHLEDHPIVVVISHREDMLMVCDRIVRMDMGRIQQSV